MQLRRALVHMAKNKSVDAASDETKKTTSKATDVVADVVHKVEHAVEDAGSKVKHAGEALVGRVDSAMHHGREKAKDAADVNGDGIVNSEDAKAAGEKCTKKCSIQ